MQQDRPEDLFDVFEPWTEPETEPWEPPPTRMSAVQVRAEPTEKHPRMTSEGALEPAPVIQPPPSMSQPRRRVGPRIPPPEPSHDVDTPDPAEQPAEFLRVVGIPEIDRVASRLDAMGHHIRVQDLLDLPDAALRVLFWPQPGLMEESKQRPRAMLEFTVSRDEPDEMAAHFWFHAEQTEPSTLGRVSVELLDLAWVRSRVLDFVEKVLSRA
ncbi:MAG: hypothetical protein PVJ02_03140 [Gemmatimonadota bacterium]